MNERKHDSQPERRPARILLRPRVVDDGQKRAADRTSTRREVAVQFGGESLTSTCRLQNVSPTGLQLSLDRLLEEGTELSVEVLPTKTLAAVVRWARPADNQNDGFVIGAEWQTPLHYDDVWLVRSYE
jgi:hypothetical protein